MNTSPNTPSLFHRLWMWAEQAIRGLNALQPAAQLWARWYVAGVFFRTSACAYNAHTGSATGWSWVSMRWSP